MEDSEMKELIEYIAKSLVDQPDAVKVTEVEGERTSVIELNVAGENCNGNEDSLECSFHETEKKNYIRNHRVVFVKFFYHEVKSLFPFQAKSLTYYFSIIERPKRLILSNEVITFNEKKT